MENYHGEMSSRVQALETLNIQKDDESLISEDDTETLTTIRALSPDVSHKRPIEPGMIPLDFSYELQKSRVYRRTQAFQESGISALTKSTYSLGRSFRSDVSMAEVSNIAVVNLAIPEAEVFNPRRSAQPWTAQTNREVSAHHRVDRQHPQLSPIAHDGSLTVAQGSLGASLLTIADHIISEAHTPPLPRGPVENVGKCHQSEKLAGEKQRMKNIHNSNAKSTLSPRGLSDPSESLLDLAGFSPQFQVRVEDEEQYPCKGCGEVGSHFYAIFEARCHYTDQTADEYHAQ